MWINHHRTLFLYEYSGDSSVSTIAMEIPVFQTNPRRWSKYINRAGAMPKRYLPCEEKQLVPDLFRNSRNQDWVCLWDETLRVQSRLFGDNTTEILFLLLIRLSLCEITFLIEYSRSNWYLLLLPLEWDTWDLSLPRLRPTCLSIYAGF